MHTALVWTRRGCTALGAVVASSWVGYGITRVVFDLFIERNRTGTG